YDYSAADGPPVPAAYFAKHKGEFVQDARLLDWDEEDPALAQRLGVALCGRLAALERDPAVQRILVVTHLPLFDEQMPRKPWDRRWSMSNAFFGNITVGRQVAAFGKVACVVSGHTHIPRQGRVVRAGAPDLLVAVVPSDYRAPGYLVVDLASDATAPADASARSIARRPPAEATQGSTNVTVRSGRVGT